MKKLTDSQQKALDKLTNTWQSRHTLRVGRNTLDSLVERGLADRRYPLGSIAFPDTTEYRRASEPVNPG
jgi:hypothetical protein